MSGSGKYKAAVIGCGMMGSLYNDSPIYDPHYSHAAAFSGHDRTTLAAVCDLDPDKLEKAAAKWRVKPYNDAKAMLAAEQPVIVGIAAPTQMHGEMIAQCLATDSVRGILCEKPFADDVKTAQTAIDACAKRGVALLVNYSRRFDSGHRKARQLIVDGALGKIVHARGLFQKGLLHNGSHLIDLCRWYFGEVTGVATLGNICVLSFENGVKATLEEVPATNGAVMDFDVLGTEGRLVFEQGGSVIKFLKKTPSRHFPFASVFDAPEILSEGMRDTTLLAVGNLIKCLENKGETPLCSGLDGLRAIEIVQTALQKKKG